MSIVLPLPTMDLMRVTKMNEILSQGQNEGCNRCSGPTDPDCRGCSGPNSGVKDRVAVPEDADSEGLQCSKEIVL